MKNKTIYLFAVCALLFAGSCSKKKSAFSYKISSFPDISVRQYSDTTISLPIKITLADGKSEMVTIIPDTGTPGIFDSITTATTDTFPFSTTFGLHVSMNVAGTYPVTIKTKSPSTDTQSHTFNVIVTENNVNCTSSLTGTYSVSGSAAPDFKTCFIYASSNKLVIPTVYNSTVMATVDCGSGKLNIESTSFFYGDFLGGTGTFTSSTITIDYKLRMDGGIHGPDGTHYYNEVDVKNVYTR